MRYITLRVVGIVMIVAALVWTAHITIINFYPTTKYTLNVFHCTLNISECSMITFTKFAIVGQHRRLR